MNNQSDFDYDTYLQQAYEEQADRYSHPERKKQGRREYRIKSRGNGISRTRLCRAMKSGEKLKGYYWKFKE